MVCTGTALACARLPRSACYLARRQLRGLLWVLLWGVACPPATQSLVRFCLERDCGADPEVMNMPLPAVVGTGTCTHSALGMAMF